MRPLASRVLLVSLFAISACAAGDPVLGAGAGDGDGAGASSAAEPEAHRPTGAAPTNARAGAARAPAATAATAILHGHNDYLQPVPLQRALALGLGSVEADVFLEGGELRVGHERWQLRAGRTLRALYLEPLRAHVAAHGSESLSRDPLRPFVLLVDIKADGDAVYRALRAELADFAPMLTRFVDGRVERGPVTVILSGTRPRALLAAERDRWCALDGRQPRHPRARPRPRTALLGRARPPRSVAGAARTRHRAHRHRPPDAGRALGGGSWRRAAVTARNASRRTQTRRWPR